MEDAFQRVKAGCKRAMKELEAKLTGQLKDLVALVREPLANHTRRKVNTLLIIDVHARDIVDGFVRESILHAKVRTALDELDCGASPMNSNETKRCYKKRLVVPLDETFDIWQAGSVCRTRVRRQRKSTIHGVCVTGAVLFGPRVRARLSEPQLLSGLRPPQCQYL